MCEFSNQWLAGLQPKLTIETSPNGDILVSSSVRAENVQHQARKVAPDYAGEASGPKHNLTQLRRPSQHRYSPSYLRRLCQRAAARAAENKLKKHPDTLIFTYEECNIC